MRHVAEQFKLPIKVSNEHLHWEKYSCGCTSPTAHSEDELPGKCAKHNEPYLQRYMSRKNRPTVEQTEDRSPVFTP